MNIEFEIITTAEQAQAAAKIADITWREHYSPILSMGQIDYMLQNQTAGAISQQIADTHTYYLIKCNGEIVGYTALDRAENLDNLLFISKIYVLHDYRAHGIGHALMKFYTEIGKKEGYNGLFLHVNKHNPSVAAYKKLGFFERCAMVTDIGQGYVMDDYCMELDF